MGPISNSGKERCSTFKCERTSHSVLQMFILASRYPTKPAFFFDSGRLKSSICPEEKKHWGRKDSKEVELLSFTDETEKM